MNKVEVIHNSQKKDSVWKYDYDAAGKIISCISEYECIGHIETNIDEYQYDELNRLLRIKTKDGFHAKSYTSTEYEYESDRVIITLRYLDYRSNVCLFQKTIRYIRDGKISKIKNVDSSSRVTMIAEYSHFQNRIVKQENDHEKNTMVTYDVEYKIA